MGKTRNTATRIVGTDGDDRLVLPAGATLPGVTIDGGKGSDTLDLSGYNSKGVYIRVEPGYSRQNSSVAEQPFTGVFGSQKFTAPLISGSIRNVENLIGTSGDDFLYVMANGPIPKRVEGGPGDDVVHSLGGNARLIGGPGSDWLVSYWENNVLIAGDDDGDPSPDGVRDFFYLGSAPTILDYEVGTDHILLESVAGSVAAIYNSVEWRAEGSGSSLWINGVREVTLANVGVEQAKTIAFGLILSAVDNVVEGGPNDDFLYVSGSAGVETRVMIGANSGDDVLKVFDLGWDRLVFAPDLDVVWSNSIVNGATALVATFQGGSITIEGLSMADVPAIRITGPAGSLAPSADPVASAWSNANDFPAAQPASTMVLDGNWWA